jgi:flagellar hook-basal body complex protein FliE
MLPIPGSIGALELPKLPPVPSGPNPTAPGSFNHMFDKLSTAAEQRQAMAPGPQLPTAMEMRPLMLPPAASLSQPFVGGVEFPDAVGPDGLKLPGTSNKTRPVNPTGKAVEATSPFAFLQPLASGLDETNRLQGRAQELSDEAALGGDVDLHDVMISAEKAGVAMQLTLQVRNKLVEAYQEVMRMQV